MSAIPLSQIARTHVSLADFRPFLRSFRIAYLLYILCATVTRLVISFRMETTNFRASPIDFASAFLIGTFADLLVGLILAAALSLPFLWMRKLWNGRRKRWIGAALLFVMVWGMVFGAVAEIFFWEEFANRFNGIAVSYLIFPREVIGNLQESFNFAIWMPIICLVTVLIWLPAIRPFLAGLEAHAHKGWKRKGLLCSVTVICAGVLIIQILPGRISENRELNELAKNGLISLVHAAITNDEEYLGKYPTVEGIGALAVLRKTLQQENTRYIDPMGTDFPILREVSNPGPVQMPNIVVVIEESFGSNLVDTLDNQTGVEITPNLTRLAKEGVWFTNIYASGDRTVRGLEAILTSFAPIPGISTARRPGSKGMYSVPDLLGKKGYSSAMLYGGQAMFDNMGSFWDGIGFENVWDQNDVRHEAFSTIWGVSDEDLFTEGLKRLDENAMTSENGKNPLFFSLLTVSNHRPYKFPQSVVKWKEDRGKIENTATYADWAFGDFIERAREKPWFDNTVFVFIADHGRKVNGASQVPLHRFRIPVLFYGPKYFKQEEIATLGAQIDVIPTLLGKLGFSYISPFFGLDLARVKSGQERIIVAHNFSVAYGKKEEVVVLEPTGDVLGYHFDVSKPALSAKKPGLDVKGEAISVVQTAHGMFYGGKYHFNR